MTTAVPQVKVTSISGALPVDLQAAKLKLGIDYGDFDTEVDLALFAAAEFCESQTGRVFRSSATVEASYSCWPLWSLGFSINPVQSITSVEYYADGEATLTALAGANYRLIESSSFGSLLEFDSETSFPDLDNRADAVKISYVAGYGSGPVPAAARQAILLKTQLLYGDLESRDVRHIEMALDSLLMQMTWKHFG